MTSIVEEAKQEIKNEIAAADREIVYNLDQAAKAQAAALRALNEDFDLHAYLDNNAYAQLYRTRAAEWKTYADSLYAQKNELLQRVMDWLTAQAAA